MTILVWVAAVGMATTFRRPRASGDPVSFRFPNTKTLDSRFRGNDEGGLGACSLGKHNIVVPAQAGTHFDVKEEWIPACAGMTKLRCTLTLSRFATAVLFIAQ